MIFHFRFCNYIRANIHRHTFTIYHALQFRLSFQVQLGLVLNWKPWHRYSYMVRFMHIFGSVERNYFVLFLLYTIVCSLSLIMEKFYYLDMFLLRHLQSFWGASGDFWQAQWDKFIDKTGKCTRKLKNL